jgi:hypothetical protein
MVFPGIKFMAALMKSGSVRVYGVAAEGVGDMASKRRRPKKRRRVGRRWDFILGRC